MLIRRLPGQRIASRHRAEPAPASPAASRRRLVGPAAVVGGAVWIVLAGTAAVAGFGGIFSPSGPTRASASTVVRSVDTTKFPEPPAGSGQGRRVVFDQSEQRVWLVSAGGTVERSYLVTGSKWDNLRPGSYGVSSKTRHARTYRGGGTFEYFVKFAQGHTSAIGFHTVTVRNNGTMVYARDDLGTARTPGCIEAMPEDARALWDFAPVGTKVVVTA